MAAIIVDTHAIIWYLTEPDMLSSPALAALEEASDQGDPAYLSVITIVETIYLVEKGKLSPLVLERLVRAIEEESTNIVVAPLDFPIAQTLQKIPRNLVPDMPDRLIAATALHLNLPLVTRDHKIRQTEIHTIW